MQYFAKNETERLANIRIIYFFAVFLLVFADVRLASTEELPKQVFGKNLTECVGKLNGQIGGWCEIRLMDKHPSISSVWPKNLSRRTHMVTGPVSILGAWNGAGFDEESRIFYFFGGGHADYGGNEVYEFRLDDGTWRRLTDPSPLNHLYRVKSQNADAKKKYCWVQDVQKVPSAAHTYDGIQFSRRTKTIFVIIHGAANGSCFVDKEGAIEKSSNLLSSKDDTRAIYEFNPSRSETRNNLGPLKWRRLKRSAGYRYPRTVELPNGAMMVGSKGHMFEFDPATGTSGRRVLREADFGDGLAKYHPGEFLLLLSQNTLRVRNLRTGEVSMIPAPQQHGKSLAVAASGAAVSWNGVNKILSINPSEPSPRWTLYDWKGSGPQLGYTGRVYSKWQYIKRDDVFVGLSSHKTGVWVYKHPKNMKGTTFSDVNLQKLIKQAKTGSTVTLPPGDYSEGLVINKSLTVRMADVNLAGIARNRAIVNIACDNCDVTVEDFKANARMAGCLGRNCAAIKVEGVRFRLTVKRAHIDNPVMGILTDNRGGVLNIEDTVIENTGFQDKSSEVAHGIYAGLIDEVRVKNTTIRNVHGDGHIFKSRARTTVLENVKFLGESGYHSRTIDLPCGGTFVLKRSVLQHGANTDNSDLISVGTEPKHCKVIEPANVSITDSIIVFDRDHSPDERARSYGPNALFNWRAPLGDLDVRGNKIVNLEQWSYRGKVKGVTIPDQSSMNTMCDSRKACGI